MWEEVSNVFLFPFLAPCSFIWTVFMHLTGPQCWPCWQKCMVRKPPGCILSHRCTNLNMTAWYRSYLPSKTYLFMWMIKQNNNRPMTNLRPHLGSQKSWGPQLEESCTILADSYFHLRLPFYRMRETLRMIEMMNGEKDSWLQLFLLPSFTRDSHSDLVHSETFGYFDSDAWGWIFPIRIWKIWWSGCPWQPICQNVLFLGHKSYFWCIFGAGKSGREIEICLVYVNIQILAYLGWLLLWHTSL